jgi:hypothetical protein
MRASEQLNELAGALSKAQAMLRGAVKDSTNPHFKSRYADLASCWDACREALAANGLSVVQLPEGNGGVVEMTTMLLHTSGQWIACTGCFTATKADPQGLGSCITYARRYQLCAIVGISPEDDDGNAASEPVKQQAKPERKPEPKPEPKPPAKTLDPDLAEILRGFGWVAQKRQINADILLAMFGCNLAQCMESAGVAQAAVISIQRWLSECDGDTPERRLSMLWNAALMENGVIKPSELKPYKEDPRDG